MKPEAQRIAIAEACGWTSAINSKSRGGIYGLAPHESFLGMTTVPGYLNDLNAMHEAIESLSYQDQVEWVYKLGEVLGFRNRNEWTEISMIQATAAQRAEAFLRTIGKWEGGAE